MADINIILTIDDGLDADIQVGTCVDHFTDLQDCPSIITANQYVKGNAGGTALEFGVITSTTPGGSDKQLQYNNSGAFAGIPSVKYTSGTSKLQLGEGGTPIIEEHNGQVYQVMANDGTQNGTFVLNMTAHNDHIVTADNNLILQMTGQVAGMSGVIILKITGAGGYTISLDPAHFTTKLNGSDDIDTVTGKKNFISWYYDGTFLYYTNTKEA